jgi:hypothetical protein
MSSLASLSALNASAGNLAAAGSSAVRAETIRALRRQLVSAQQTQSSQRVIPTGLRSLDQLLPGGGLPTSALIEWISDETGQAAASVALRAVAPLLSLPGCLAVIDENHDFHGNAAKAQGIPLSKILLVRPPRPTPEEVAAANQSRDVRRVSVCHAEALWALEQVARNAGVRAVLCWLDRASPAVMRRLQLAVERSGVTILLIRPATVLGSASFADLRLHIQPVNLPDHILRPAPPKARPLERRSLSVRLLRSRHGIQHEGTATLHQNPWDDRVRD